MASYTVAMGGSGYLSPDAKLSRFGKLWDSTGHSRFSRAPYKGAGNGSRFGKALVGAFKPFSALGEWYYLLHPSDTR
jgi:hypothetical protein